MQKHDLLYQLLSLSRPLYQEAQSAVGTMLSGTRITVRMRAVLEALEQIGPATVPAVARHLGIKRQYVQVMMNEVESSGLVTRRENPAHKRSALFTLGDIGAEVISGIRKAEMRVMESLARDLTQDEIEMAHHVAEHLLHGFQKLNKDLKA